VKNGRIPWKNRMAVRIGVVTGLIAMAILLLSGILIRNHFSGIYEQTALDTAESEENVVCAAVSEQVSWMVERFIETCGTEEFVGEMVKMNTGERENDLSITTEVQDVLEEMVNSSTQVRTALISDRAGGVYHRLSESVKAGAAEMLEEMAEEVRGISILSERESPVRGEGNVIPMAFPMKRLRGSNLVVTALDPEETEIILWLMMDAEKFDTFLQGFGGEYYLLDADGTVLNGSGGDAAEDIARSRVWESADETTVTIAEGEEYYLPARKLTGRSETLVYAAAKEDVTARTRNLNRTILRVVLGALLMTILFTATAMIYVHRPLRRLTKAVEAVENETYTPDMRLTQKDELGQLSGAIDRMYSTIQGQMDEIRDEREAKYDAEVRLITEQINPHFLYNTLEFINLEVYNHHNESASAMIQALGDFLRLGLNFGDEMTEIESEIEHVRAYICIMNHRFSGGILLETEVEEGLEKEKIPKLILQPLVENSIRHGFLVDADQSYLSSPAIRVSVKRSDGEILLKVTDNGIGIDVEKAQKAMTTPSGQSKHVGLNNIYERVRKKYGEQADITFQSIPYYRNTVSIHLPDEAER